ncbi:MAG: hypothetical protein ACRC2T_12730, partial [Thermoguttaceae bacterium]
ESAVNGNKSERNGNIESGNFDDFNWNPFEDDNEPNTPTYQGSDNVSNGTQTTASEKESANPIYRSVLSGFATKRVDDTSDEVRKLLKQYAPEIVTTAEQFASVVKYIPMSATGRAPTLDPQSGMLGFRPKDIAPVWAEVPILYAFAKSTRGVIPVLQPKK